MKDKFLKFSLLITESLNQTCTFYALELHKNLRGVIFKF